MYNLLCAESFSGLRYYRFFCVNLNFFKPQEEKLLRTIIYGWLFASKWFQNTCLYCSKKEAVVSCMLRNWRNRSEWNDKLTTSLACFWTCFKNTLCRTINFILWTPWCFICTISYKNKIQIMNVNYGPPVQTLKL